MKKTFIFALIGIGIPAGLIQSTRAAVDFVKEVKPLLEMQCLSCHGPKKQMGGLRLDNAEQGRQRS